MTRIAVFASGRGSNFRALADAERTALFPGRIVLLIVDKPDAGALDIARELGIASRVIPPDRPGARLSTETEQLYVDACREAGVEWICLAGFMRILGATLLDSFRERVLNIHPSLLPSFPGLDAQRQAWEHGARISGCTVHFVDRGVDTGPIILQRAVPVLPTDSADDLAARILVEEHKIYAEALKIVLAAGWRREGRRIITTHSEGTIL